jgi:hypothetical protein
MLPVAPAKGATTRTATSRDAAHEASVAKQRNSISVRAPTALFLFVAVVPKFSTDRDEQHQKAKRRKLKKKNLCLYKWLKLAFGHYLLEE